MENIPAEHDIFGDLITQKRGSLHSPILVLRARTQNHHIAGQLKLNMSVFVNTGI